MVTKAGSDCFSLPLKATEEDNEEEKPTASPAAANEMSLDAAVAAFRSDLDGISPLKEEQRTVLKAPLGRKDVLALLLTG